MYRLGPMFPIPTEIVGIGNRESRWQPGPHGFWLGNTTDEAKIRDAMYINCDIKIRSPIASNPKNIFYKIRAISGRRKSRFEEPKGRCISPNRPGLIIYTSAKNNGPKVTYPMAIIIIFSPAKRVIIQRYGAYSHVQTTSEGAFLPT